MNWHIVKQAEVTPSPWRNGGGITRELVAWPDPHAWRWRISNAAVARDGPFSRFDGVERWLAILSGAGVYLDFPDRTVTLTAKDAPLAFAGSEPVNCRLIDGPVQDLNLMLRHDTGPGAAAGQMRRVGGTARRQLEVARAVAVYNLGQAATLSLDGIASALPQATLLWRHLPAGSTLDIEASSAICMEMMD